VFEDGGAEEAFGAWVICGDPPKRPSERSDVSMEGGKAVFPASTGLWEGGEAVFPVSPGPPETGNAVFPPSGGSRGAGKRAFPPSSDSREAGKTMFPPSSETPETGNATLPLSNPPSQTGKTALPLSGKREETGKTAFPPSKVRPESENEPPEGGKAAFPPSNPAHFSKPWHLLGRGRHLEHRGGPGAARAQPRQHRRRGSSDMASSSGESLNQADRRRSQMKIRSAV